MGKPDSQTGNLKGETLERVDTRGTSHVGSALPGEGVDDIRLLPIGSLTPNPHNPRSHFFEEDLAGLAASIKEHGVLQPIIVRPIPGDLEPGQSGRFALSSPGKEHGNGRSIVEADLVPSAGSGITTTWQIVAGERRWRASMRAGLSAVPCKIKSLTDAEALAVSLVENIQRNDLQPIEMIEGMAGLESLALSPDEIARKLGKSVATVSKYLAISRHPDIMELVRAGELGIRRAYERVVALRRSEDAAPEYDAFQGSDGGEYDSTGANAEREGAAFDREETFDPAQPEPNHGGGSVGRGENVTVAAGADAEPLQGDDVPDGAVAEGTPIKRQQDSASHRSDEASVGSTSSGNGAHAHAAAKRWMATVMKLSDELSSPDAPESLLLLGEEGREELAAAMSDLQEAWADAYGSATRLTR